MKRHILLLLLLALAAPAGAELVGLWTFARTNALEAKVGTDALEGTGKSPVVTSATTNTLYAVTDAAVLGDRTGVLAVPKGSGILIPVPAGLSTTYCLAFDFYPPVSLNWYSLFTLDQNNSIDAFFWIRNGTDLGARGTYETVGSMIGRWNQLVVSMDNGVGTLWLNGTKLRNARSWDLSGLAYVLMSMDYNNDDPLQYFDEVRLYDEARPAAIFPDGENAAVYATDRDDGTPSASVSSTFSRFGVLTVGVDVDDPGDETCALEAVVETADGRTLVRTLSGAFGAGSFSFDLDDLGLAFGTHGTVCVRATGSTNGRTSTSAARAFAFSTNGSPGTLWGLWTFARENPLEAKIGPDAAEGTGKNPVVQSATTNALYAVTDPAVLGGRTGVLALPKGAGVVLPLPDGVSNTWCFAFDFYPPAQQNWYALFNLQPSNGSDASFFIKNGNQIGLSQYDPVGDLVGSWHQLVISMDAGVGTVYVDGTKLSNSRSWNLAGVPWILLSMDNDGDDALLYFDEARFYDEARPADIFPSAASLPYSATDPDDGTPGVDLVVAGVSADGLSLRLSGSVAESGDDACSLVAVIAAGGGAERSRTLAASATAGTFSFQIPFASLGLETGAACTVRIVATGLVRGKTASTAAKSFVVPDANAAIFGEAASYGVSIQRVTAAGTLERLGAGENTLLLVATGADGVRRTLASVPVSATGAFTVSGVFPGTGTVEAQVLCSNVVAGVSYVAAMPSAVLALEDDTSTYVRNGAAAPDAAWDDPAAWTASGYGVANAAGFPTEPTPASFPAAGAVTTRIPAGTWKALMHLEFNYSTNLFAGVGVGSSVLDVDLWFSGTDLELVLTNLTFVTKDFGFRRNGMRLRVDGARWVANGRIDMADARVANPRLEVANGGRVEFNDLLWLGSTNAVIALDGGRIRGASALQLYADVPGLRIDVAVPETPPSDVLVRFASLTRNGAASVTVNVVENRSRTPGNVPVLLVDGGIPDGFVELGAVPHPERTERLFFGYDGTDAETGTLRTGVWYRSRPILPTIIMVK